MTDQFSSISDKIHALRTGTISLLETTRDRGVPAETLQMTRTLLIEVYQKLLNDGAKHLLKENFVGSESAVRLVEDAYKSWRAIDAAFRETLSLAYVGTIPRQNLLIDDVHAELRQRVGDPTAALYTRIYKLWTDHLRARPWDTHLGTSAKHADNDDLEAGLHALVHGDHLDVEDALVTLSGPLRYAFADYIERQDDPLELLEESLWMRPEILVINDYWQYHPQVRLLDLLRRKSGRKRSGSFAAVHEFFSEDNAGAGSAAAERVVAGLKNAPFDERDTHLRCLTLHPNHDVRRYAVTNVDLDGFWKVVTPETVPLTTVLSMLERVASSKRYDEDFQKVFFHAVHRRLLSTSSRSDVLYARGIVRILAELPFFMEDDYFEKLMGVVDYLAAKERQYGVETGVLEEYIEKLRRQKDRIGTLRTDSPNIAQVPAVVLRKLARDGHFWFELSMHPLYKIARETVRHIHSPDRALRVANNHVVNQDVLREIGRKRGLFSTRPARMALLGNPRTPPAVSLDYLSDLSRQDREHLLRRATIHPELRRRLLERQRV
jgi:hypothetical protein